VVAARYFQVALSLGMIVASQVMSVVLSGPTTGFRYFQVALSRCIVSHASQVMVSYLTVRSGGRWLLPGGAVGHHRAPQTVSHRMAVAAGYFQVALSVTVVLLVGCCVERQSGLATSRSRCRTRWWRPRSSWSSKRRGIAAVSYFQVALSVVVSIASQVIVVLLSPRRRAGNLGYFQVALPNSVVSMASHVMACVLPSGYGCRSLLPGGAVGRRRGDGIPGHRGSPSSRRPRLTCSGNTDGPSCCGFPHFPCKNADS
jgi:hypothetical protein